MAYLDQDEILQHIAAEAKRVGPDEAALIWLLSDLVEQCLLTDQGDACAFVPKHPVGRWGCARARA